MSSINTADAKEQFSDLINRVSHHKECVIFTRRGKEIAVMIPMEDWQLLQASRDKSDLQQAVEALQEARTQGTISLDELKESIG
ncbi:MAG: type II toxin-antitoxin system Phd/YefM family antitoxin [Gammaproteobacteria bacterium]|nr:MAG: type II toxin-antitoxin system Phd/YefM family antitoxin [Gammaproteobacteria bacterium]